MDALDALEYVAVQVLSLPVPIHLCTRAVLADYRDLLAAARTKVAATPNACSPGRPIPGRATPPSAAASLATTPTARSMLHMGTASSLGASLGASPARALPCTKGAVAADDEEVEGGGSGGLLCNEVVGSDVEGGIMDSGEDFSGNVGPLEEWMDPITACLMEEPVRLPDSGVSGGGRSHGAHISDHSGAHSR